MDPTPAPPARPAGRPDRTLLVIVGVIVALVVIALVVVFTRGELIAVIFATFVLGQAVADGSSTWFKGIQLLAVYTIIGIAFYFVP